MTYRIHRLLVACLLLQGTNYGQLAEYFFNIIRTNPNCVAIEDKLVLVIGGPMDGAAQYHFGASAVTNAPSADILAIAPTLPVGKPISTWQTSRSSSYSAPRVCFTKAQSTARPRSIWRRPVTSTIW